MELLERWYEQARRSPRRILLADAGDDRAIEAADRLNADGLAEAEVVDPKRIKISEDAHQFARDLAKPVDLEDPLDVATLLVAVGDADGCVAGASRSTADVIRAGLRILGTDGPSAVSSCALRNRSSGPSRPHRASIPSILTGVPAASLAKVSIRS